MDAKSIRLSLICIIAVLAVFRYGPAERVGESCADDRLSCSELVVRDRDGRVRVRIGPVGDGDKFSVEMLEVTGEPEVSVVQGDGAPSVSLEGHGGNAGSGLNFGVAAGSSYLTVFSGEDQVRALAGWPLGAQVQTVIDETLRWIAPLDVGAMNSSARNRIAAEDMACRVAQLSRNVFQAKGLRIGVQDVSVWAERGFGPRGTVAKDPWGNLYDIEWVCLSLRGEEIVGVVVISDGPDAKSGTWDDVSVIRLAE